MNPTRRAAFRSALDARIARRVRGWRWSAAALASAAALSLWLARTEVKAPSQPSLTGTDLYAFIEPDSDTGSMRESGIYLPDDYRAIATLIEIDEAAR